MKTTITPAAAKAYYKEREAGFHAEEVQRLRDPLYASRAVERALYPDDGEDMATHRAIIAKLLVAVGAAHGIALAVEPMQAQAPHHR